MLIPDYKCSVLDKQNVIIKSIEKGIVQQPSKCGSHCLGQLHHVSFGRSDQSFFYLFLFLFYFTSCFTKYLDTDTVMTILCGEIHFLLLAATLLQPVRTNP